VITCRGRTFAGRVGASLLSAAGLPELITESLESYRECALGLARSPSALAGLREQLSAARATAPVFDSDGYVRDFEAALFRLWRRS
jgi:predicted O-linked N-acetylglucosamine transferase (SPINDLY family)